VIEFGARTRRLPAPPHVVWESLVGKAGHIRRRVNHLLFADLRSSCGR
jgi:hypothetical protein